MQSILEINRLIGLAVFNWFSFSILFFQLSLFWMVFLNF